jgi:segregation and condensation protein A
VIGAKLLVIKTRALLPKPPAELTPTDDEDVGDQLARQLAEYQRFKQAAAQLRAREAQGMRAYARLNAPPLPTPGPPPALQVTLADLITAVQRRLQLMLPLDEEVVALPAPKIITIAEVRARLYATLRQRAWISFDDLLGLALTRNEVIVTLWTVLELFKRGAITIEQERLFGAISIGRGPAFDAGHPIAIDDGDAS